MLDMSNGESFAPESPQFKDTNRDIRISIKLGNESPIEFRDEGYELDSDKYDQLSCKMSENSFGSDLELKNNYATHLDVTDKAIDIGEKTPMYDYADS